MENDLISRQAAIEAIVNTPTDVYSHDRIVSVLDGAAFRQNEIIDIINELPSAQPEIIRCEECNKSKEWPNGRWCSLFRASVNTDSYCSFGAKRKEGRKE